MRSAAILAAAVALTSGLCEAADFGLSQRPASSSLVSLQIDTINETDEERLMHNRIARFLGEPGGKAKHGPGDVAAYYRWLSTTDFRSSPARFRLIANDIASDTEMLPAAFDAICAVRDIDRDREVAMIELDLQSEMGSAVAQRRDRNQAEIGHFVNALAFRYQSYGFAIDRLLVETPHKEAVAADDRLGELAVLVGAAERWEFCGPVLTIDGPIELEPN
jgi:hypothetical protein